MTLDPGDIIITGTPSGVAMARNPQPWLKNGDVCEVEIEKIGILRNVIAQGGVEDPPSLHGGVARSRRSGGV